MNYITHFADLTLLEANGLTNDRHSRKIGFDNGVIDAIANITNHKMAH